MSKVFWICFVFIATLNAEAISASKYAKLVQKGEKIALKLCEESKLLALQSKTLPNLLIEIEKQKPCLSLNTRNKEALAYFILAGSQNTHKHNKDIGVVNYAVGHHLYL